MDKLIINKYYGIRVRINALGRDSSARDCDTAYRTTTRARVHCSLDHHSRSSRIIDIMHNHATPADESRRGDTSRRTLSAARCGAQRFPIVWHPRVHVASHALSSSERLNM